MSDEVKVIAGGEGGGRGISPAVGIEVEADDEVGLEFSVHAMPAGADFGGPVEETFGFAEDLCFRGGAAFGGEALACCGDQFRGPQGSERVGGVAEEEDGRAQVFKPRFEQLGGGEREVAFPYGRGIPVLEGPLFHGGPWSAEVSRIDGDADAVEWPGGGGGREVLGAPPEPSGHRGRSGVRRKGEHVGVIGSRFPRGGTDEGFARSDLDVGEPCTRFVGEDGIDQAGKLLAGEGSVPWSQTGPVRRGGQRCQDPCGWAGRGGGGLAPAAERECGHGGGGCGDKVPAADRGGETGRHGGDVDRA